MHITSSQTPSIAEEAIHLLIRAAQEGRNLAQGAQIQDVKLEAVGFLALLDRIHVEIKL
jgi:hypothetical protein